MLCEGEGLTRWIFRCRTSVPPWPSQQAIGIRLIINGGHARGRHRSEIECAKLVLDDSVSNCFWRRRAAGKCRICASCLQRSLALPWKAGKPPPTQTDAESGQTAPDQTSRHPDCFHTTLATGRRHPSFLSGTAGTAQRASSYFGLIPPMSGRNGLARGVLFKVWKQWSRVPAAEPHVDLQDLPGILQGPPRCEWLVPGQSRAPLLPAADPWCVSAPSQLQFNRTSPTKPLVSNGGSLPLPQHRRHEMGGVTGTRPQTIQARAP